MGIKLVIVDDAPFIREIIRNTIEEAGMECIGEAENGEEAVELVLKKKPDIVLMDLVMPEKNGIEATREILEELPAIKVIACTTLTQKEMVLQALDAGCIDHIAKPFQGDELVKKIESVWQR